MPSPAQATWRPRCTDSRGDQQGERGAPQGERDVWFPFYFASWYKKSPYYDRTVDAGATSWDLYNHMLIPTLYDDDVKEYWHLLNHVTLWDVAVERQVEITGPDAARFTQLLTPRDLSTCAVGQGKYVLICAPDGGIVNDPILLRLGENHFWLSLADSDALLYALGVAAFADMDVQIREPDVSPLQLQGPKSKQVIQKLFGDDVMNLRYYWCTETELNGIPLVISRTGWTGEVGYELYLRDSSRGGELWDTVIEAGRAFDITPYGTQTMHVLRAEKGFIVVGHETDGSVTPIDLGLERMVSRKKDFIGRRSLSRADTSRADRKHMVGILPEDPRQVLPEGAQLVAGDLSRPRPQRNRTVPMLGHVTSSYFSANLDRSFGLALVKGGRARIGEWVWVPLEDETLRARIVAPVFFDPEGVRQHA